MTYRLFTRGKLLLGLLLVGILILIPPAPTEASTLQTGRAVVLSETPKDNVYLVGTDVTAAAPVANDISALGGTVSIEAPVAGDALLAGGTVQVKKNVAGDARMLGGSLVLEGNIGGDLVAVGGSVTVAGVAKDVRIGGGSIRMEAGAMGPVVLYGADVYLAGDYPADVTVNASNKLIIAEHTHIHGVLHYSAPQQIDTPADARIDGGATYTGSSSFLPTTKEAHTFAIVSAGILLVVRIVAALVAAGLIAGLFPLCAAALTARVLSQSPRRMILLTLLGFAVLVATPVLIVLLLVSFVGIGVALILAAAYVLLLLLAYVYAAVLLGSVLARTLMKRRILLWRDAVFGMVLLYLLGSIPKVGFLLSAILTAAALGGLVSLAYGFAFPRSTEQLSQETDTSL